MKSLHVLGCEPATAAMAMFTVPLLSDDEFEEDTASKAKNQVCVFNKQFYHCRIWLQ